MDNSAALSTLTPGTTIIIIVHFIAPHRNSTHWTSPQSLPAPPVSSNVLSVSLDLPLLRISCNHLIRGFLCPTSFIQHHVFKIIHIVQFIFFLATLCGMRDLSSPTRDRSHAPLGGWKQGVLLDCQGSPCHAFSWLCRQTTFCCSIHLLITHRLSSPFGNCEQWTLAYRNLSPCLRGFGV